MLRTLRGWQNVCTCECSPRGEHRRGCQHGRNYPEIRANGMERHGDPQPQRQERVASIRLSFQSGSPVTGGATEMDALSFLVVKSQLRNSDIPEFDWPQVILKANVPFFRKILHCDFQNIG